MVGKSIVALVLAALVAVGWTRHEDRLKEQDRLAKVASELVGRRVGVRCPNFVKKLVYTSAEAGTVGFDGNGKPNDFTELAPETCDALRRVSPTDFDCLDTGTCADKQFRKAWAIQTVAHEVWHMRGIGEESTTQCYGMQTTAAVAIRLGLSPARAAQIQHWVFVKGYPDMPDEYRTSACHNGSRLDLNPASAVFP